MFELLMMLLVLIVFGLSAAVILWFILSMRKAVLCVREEKRTFAPWLLWLLAIPGLNYFIAWYLLPFAIPKTLNAAIRSERSKLKTKHIGHLGLAIQLLPLASVFLSWSQLGELLISIVIVVLFFFYWIRVVQYKHRYFGL